MVLSLLVYETEGVNVVRLEGRFVGGRFGGRDVAIAAAVVVSVGILLDVEGIVVCSLDRRDSQGSPTDDVLCRTDTSLRVDRPV
jgi:hypothetical protein